MAHLPHGSATTTARAHADIQASVEPAATLARRYGVNRKTVLKWRRREGVADAPMGPRERHVVVEGALAGGGTVTQSFVVPLSGTGFALVTFGEAFRGLSSVRWRSGGFGPAPVTNAELVAAVTVAPSSVAVIPEPASLALVGAGLAALGAAAGARRRSPRSRTSQVRARLLPPPCRRSAPQRARSAEVHAQEPRTACRPGLASAPRGRRASRLGRVRAPRRQ